MKPLAYERASSLDQAVGLLAASDVPARLLAGGTNLVDLMKLEVETPGLLVDVNHLGLDRVEDTDSGGLLIGAMVRNADLAADPRVRERYPVLARALLSAASGQIRNLATTGGNLLQRTRCVYFMDATKPCNKRLPGSGCPAIEGASRELGVLGTSRSCIATHPGDMAVALAALDAVVHYVTADGPATLAMTEFHRLPGDDPSVDTNLPPGAVITAVEVPPLPFAASSTYRKARDRRSYAFALASVAAAVDVADGRVRDVRLALGGVSHRPWRAYAAEELLRGAPATADSFRAAVEAELAAATPTDENRFKIDLVTRLVTGTLLELTGGAR
ncbi:FAD binding domain-containing protein [Aeromicrobium wangtongii]|uniref:Xanthine dehydrogenase family protein subunit M n=1 Tax=Aeromicrobium wangtongii TaxID=2969247 RepID=A0ABY5M7W3_9ACTN|nr:xanthine dehydrogenase family protein subunit M [Aeromicrobium wangtongii]MCD9198737.1 xanthine dehydrogenase family protein subunit M [Aeromicrobium wangtongii]UUP13216.1 xanthine dehydrogenase family protein subunit M [Aeromicrobium wangtongii]